MSVHIYSPLPKGLTHALFDADDTLYPASSGFQSRLIVRLIRDLYRGKMRQRDGRTPTDEAVRALSVFYYEAYGSAYVGLVREFGMTMEEIVDYVYHSGRLDYSALNPCEQTRAGLEMLRYEHRLRLAILSNGTDVHVHMVLHAMNLTGLFGVVHGFNHNRFVPKPDPSTIENTLWDMNADASQTIFIEDSLNNLRAGHSLGMGYSVFIGEHLTSQPENSDGMLGMWATTLPEALSAINEQLTAFEKAA